MVVNTRNSHKLDRLEMIKTVAENVEALKGGHSVDLKNPDRTIVIEVNKVCRSRPAHLCLRKQSSWVEYARSISTSRLRCIEKGD